ncbi:MAG: hypothetical protein CM1200mP35_10540 [Chloroflexota bacterium]|nr:MAG: hypothetical protein CM1200mP35_10540 [Chloroflexota bacterium]
MPKVIPDPNEITKPFWDAVNERRLVVQNVPSVIYCNILHYKTAPNGSPEGLEWKE